MSKLFAVALGILTAIGGFVDIGDLVTNAQVGARFGLSLAWATLVGVLGICVFAEMSGRVAAVSGRPTFDLVRERLGPRVGFLNLVSSMLITFLTFVAEIGGVALSVQLAVSVHVLLIVPWVGVAVWLILWKAKFSIMENVLGLLGLALLVFGVALWQLGPDWGALLHQGVTAHKPSDQHWSSYAYYAVALFGAAMTPYEVFFFSSGAVEEKWSVRDLNRSRANVLVGFPLGGVLSVSLAGCAAAVLLPQAIKVTSLSQVLLPVAQAGGKLLMAVILVGVVAATFGAALETTLSSGYTVAQFFGWSWGKFRAPAQAARFHLVMIIAVLAGSAVLLTGVDPIQVTELSVVFSAIALPLTYIPILIIANDPQYMGRFVNGKVTGAFAIGYLAIIVIASVAAIPLMLVTGAGK